MNAHSMIQSLGGEDEARDCRPLLSFSLGVAGDSYMGFVYNWDRVPTYHEEYNTGLSAETSIAREIERYTTELDRDWIIKQPRDIREAMELAVKCYTRALELVDSSDESLIRRLANVENELGVFFMNQGTALLDQAGAGDKELMEPASPGPGTCSISAGSTLSRALSNSKASRTPATLRCCSLTQGGCPGWRVTWSASHRMLLTTSSGRRRLNTTGPPWSATSRPWPCSAAGG